MISASTEHMDKNTVITIYQFSGGDPRIFVRWRANVPKKKKLTSKKKKEEGGFVGGEGASVSILHYYGRNFTSFQTITFINMIYPGVFYRYTQNNTFDMIFLAL